MRGGGKVPNNNGATSIAKGRGTEKSRNRDRSGGGKKKTEPLAQTPNLLVILLLIFVLIVVLLFLGLDDRGREAVEVALSVLRDLAPAVVGLLEHADLLERLADLALHVRRRVRVVRGPVAPPVAPAVQLRERADADVFPQVDVPRDCGYFFNSLVQCCWFVGEEEEEGNDARNR